MQSDRRPRVLRRRSVFAAVGGVGLAAILGTYGARGQGQTPPVPTAGGQIPATYTGGVGTAEASSVPVGTVPPPVVTMSANATVSNTALGTMSAFTTPVSGAASATAAPMGPTPTHIVGIGPLPQPLPTQGGAQPTLVGAAPPPTPAAMMATPGASATPAPAAKVMLTANQTFDPPQVTVNKGDAIQWVNMSRTPQTVTNDPALASDPKDAALPMGAQPWDSGVLNTGSGYMRAFDVPGDYTYFSIPAEGQGLVGRITVNP